MSSEGGESPAHCAIARSRCLLVQHLHTTREWEEESMKIRKYGSVLAVVLASFVGIAAAQAQTIKISHQWRAETDARDRATRVFVKAVNEKAPELKFRI